MNNKKNKAFTLIELISVLVILAILALIVTPIVLNIVKKAKDIANKRSVDAYGKTIELSVATYMLDNGEYPTCQSDLKIEYSGNEVNCNIMNLNENGSVYLSECTVGGKEVKDSSTEDGWYHYGKVSEISAEPINNSYKIGDVVTYNEMDFYVIANSDDTQDSVTLLKAEPLTVDEVNTYGVGHVNKYATSDTNANYYQKAYNKNGYGGMAYYTSPTCGYTLAGNTTSVSTGCTTDYAQSEIKYVVDEWSKDKFIIGDLKKDITGYSVRLITYDELVENLGYGQAEDGYIRPSINNYTPDWVYNSNYWYWTMTPSYDSNLDVWGVPGGTLTTNNGVFFGYVNRPNYGVVRPVVTLLKTAIKGTNLQENTNAINLKC